MSRITLEGVHTNAKYWSKFAATHRKLFMVTLPYDKNLIEKILRGKTTHKQFQDPWGRFYFELGHVHNSHLVVFKCIIFLN